MTRFAPAAFIKILTFLLVLALPAAAAAPEAQGDAQAQWLKAQAVFLRENYLHMNWKKTASGLQYLAPLHIQNPDAPHPLPDSTVTVNYEVKLVTGKVIDSSYARNMPLTIALGKAVPGWREALPMMRAGETWQFVVPAELGYGDAQMGPVPGGSALVFKIELLSF